MQSTELPPCFVLAVPDAAIAERHPAGTRVVFETAAEPRPGRPVLVQDAGGVRYVRVYGGERGTRWQAMATDSAWPTLDSEADGLQLLAVGVTALVDL
jgi:hypothetical protein